MVCLGARAEVLLGVLPQPGADQRCHIGHGLAAAAVLHSGKQRLLGSGKRCRAYGSALPFLDHAPHDAQQNAVLIALGGQRDKAGIVPRVRAGVPQAARLYARHKAGIVVILRKIARGVQIKRAVAGFGGVIIKDRKQLAAVGFFLQIQRKGVVLFGDFLLREVGKGIALAGQNRVARRGAVQRTG